MVSAPKKGLKIKRALRTAARLPARVSGGRGSGRDHLSPVAGEVPITICRIQVLGCTDLPAKDKNGTSDPFVVVSILSTRHQTPVVRRNLNPTYAAKDATFDFPIYLSLAERLGAIEIVCWDKDMLKKEYIGEAAIPLESWFKEGKALAFDDPDNKPFSVNLISTRATSSSGSIEMKCGFVTPPNTRNLMEFDEIWEELVKRSRPSLVSAPPTEGFGTIRSHEAGPAYEDDGGISSDEEGEPNSEEDEDELNVPPALSQLYTPPATPADAPTLPPIATTMDSPSTPTSSAPNNNKTPTTSKPPSPTFSIPKLNFRRPTASRSNSNSSDVYGAQTMTPTASAPVLSSTTTPTGHQRTDSGGRPNMKKNKFRKSWVKKKEDYNFSAANDIMGIVMLEIQGATDLPRLKNMTRTGWDMDPFVVISFGKKVFRTRVIRHSLNPVWDEKLLFHVRRYETAFKVQLTVLDWDKLSSNDHVGDASFIVSDLLENAPQRDPVTGLYDAEEDGNHPMKEFQLPLSTAKEMPWESKHNPVLTFRAKYQPYDALRQRFWRQYLKQYDTDDTGTLSHIEITSMLDSLGSTLSSETIASFFTRHGKKPHEDEITISEAIQCLETELCRPDSEKRRLDASDSLPDTSSLPTPTNMVSDTPRDIELERLDFSGPPMPMTPAETENSPTKERDNARMPDPPPNYPTEPSDQPLRQAALSTHSLPDERHRQASNSSSDAEDSSGSNSPSDESFERVINVKNCPLCHRPRMNSKAEMDIVTHLAVCASQDWAKVDRIMVSNFVTASQAQRKWYTKIISKVSSGNYKLGANSANIIVQNRMTGQLEEEKMQVYVRLGIRLLYKGAKSRMEGARARRLLRSMSVKQGIKYDSPESAQDIRSFISFHKLNVDEILDPIDSFKTFNQFFYRKLKPSARPTESPDDPSRLVSAADCRFMAFETVSEATKLWIKGREFTVARLLGDAYKDQADRYTGGALAIFRLAPQDYHRFHSPVDGVIGPMHSISGEYYTVNPQAIRTTLDVYGENVRKIVPIDTPQYGRVMAVCIGAMMVGSIQTTPNEGDEIKRGEELGYFAFGGSTVVVLFEKGVVEWDEDLLVNGRASLETLVRVGMGIGRLHRPSH